MNELIHPTPGISPDLALALGGPAILGLTMGLTGISQSMLTPTLMVPAAILGTTALMLPALYIGSALAGADTTARAMARDTLGALREAGIGCLGLTPAMLFLAATSGREAGAFAVTMALSVSVLLGIRGLYTRLFSALDLDVAKVKATLVFAAWALVAFGIGARLTFPAFA